jgi:hypothetical protein
MNALMNGLQQQQGVIAPTLLEETTIVVCSEFGRTPELNGDNGKDHHPWTSMLIAGRGVRGGTTVGLTDSTQEGVKVSLATPGASRSGTMDSTGTDRPPILAKRRTVGNFASQFIPVARIDTVPPGRMRSGPAVGTPPAKIPGLACSTLVSSRFESPDGVSIAISRAVAGGTAGQRNST